MDDTGKIRWPGWFASVMPWIALVLTVAGALHIRLGLGRWPTFNGGAYDSAAWTLHRFLLTWVILGSATVAPPVWIALLFFRRTKATGKTLAIQAALFCTGCGFFILFFVTDPTGFIAWWLD